MQETITKKVYKAIFNDIIASVYSSGTFSERRNCLRNTMSASHL